MRPASGKAGSWRPWTGAALVLAALAATGLAQDAAGPSTAPSGSGAGSSLPEIGQVLDAIEKASAAKEN